MDGQVKLMQGDARHLDLPDNSVDLIVTSPPYSDADAIEFLRSLEARLKLRCEISATGRGRSSRCPRLDVGLRHKNAPTFADDGDVPQVCRLVGHVRRPTSASGSLQERHQRLVRQHVRHVPPAPVRPSIEPTALDGVLCLRSLDPQVGQQRLAGAHSRRRVNIPAEKRSALGRGRLSLETVAAEQVVKQINSLWGDLLDSHSGLVGGLPAGATTPTRIVRPPHGYAPVRVNDPSRVGKISRSDI